MKKILLFIFSLLIALSALGGDQSAYDIWNDMTEAAINKHHREILVDGTEAIEKVDADGNKIKNAGRAVMFGGEKEGSSALLTRIMGPNKESFKNYVSKLPEDTREKFLKSFLSDVTSGRARIKNVKDVNGQRIKLDLGDLKGINFNRLPLKELEEKLGVYLEKAGDKHFSHLKKSTRIKIFNGKYANLTRDQGIKKLHKDYYNFVPLYGRAEKFIDAAHGTSVGWEINFLPQRSYGEFEDMVDWFRDELKNTGKRFQAPGHQWVVYPKAKEVIKSPEANKKLLSKVAEVQKNTQAYIVLKGIEGNAGIELASYKAVHPDTNFNERHSTGRGVIRLENNRFKIDGQAAFGIEYRAGVKSDKNRRRTQKFLVSRYAANEFDDIADSASWTLKKRDHFTAGEIAKRFNVSTVEANEFLKIIDGTTGSKAHGYGQKTLKVKNDYLVPLWNWENAPYLSQNKKEDLKKLTRSFIRSVNSLEDTNLQNVRKVVSDWAKVSRISHDIEAYLKPKQKLVNPEKAHVYKVAKGAKVDVNKIDLGIEYSARFPLKTSGEFVEVPGQVKKFEWQKTHYDHSREEKRKIIKNFAERLGQNLNDGKKVQAVELVSDGHGHGLDIAFEVKDDKGRKWRAEWDGIGRNYDLDSNLITDSIRGGHVEIVTPKFVPTHEDKKKLFTSLKQENLVPQTRFGGGHVNIDLKPFEGKPKKFARFIGAYLDNRHVMSVLFQHPGRQVGAEPFDVSKEVIQKLKNFNGTEEDLKKLLYNEKFYNTRVGRKTKNSQMNLTAYFQDVIPKEYIHEDFDMKNDPWRRTFDVDPNIRKVEFRMFNAPRNATESALQIKYTKALLNKALNDTDEVFKTSGKVDYEKMVKDPKYAFAEYEKTLKNLGLDPAEYRGFFVEGLEETKNMLDSPLYVPVERRLRENHPKIKDWKEAVDARKVAIGSEGRKWDGESILDEAKIYAQRQLAGRRAAENTRSYVKSANRLNRIGEKDKIKLPIELTFTLDEIKKLDKEDALVALFYQKDKLETNKKYKKYLEKLLDINTVKAGLSQQNYSASFNNFVLDSVEKHNPKLLKKQGVAIFSAVLSSDNDVTRKRALEYLKKSTAGIEYILNDVGSYSSRTSYLKEKLVALSSAPEKELREALKKKKYEFGRISQKITRQDEVRPLKKIASFFPKEESALITKANNVLLGKSDPKIKRAAYIGLKHNDPKSFFKQAREYIKEKDGDAPLQKKLSTELKSEKFLSSFSIDDLKAFDAGDKLPILYYLENRENASPKQKKDYKALLKDPEFVTLSEFDLSLQKSGDDLDFRSWVFDEFKQSKALSELKLVEGKLDSATRKQLANILYRGLEGSDEGAEVAKIVKKINDPYLNYSLKEKVLSLSKDDRLLKKTYSEIFNDKDLLSKVLQGNGEVNYKGTFSSSFEKHLHGDYPNLEKQAAKALSLQVKSHNLDGVDALKRILTRGSGKVFEKGLLIAGDNFNFAIYSTLNNLEKLRVGDEAALRPKQKKLLAEAVSKNKKSISSLRLSHLTNLPLQDKVELVLVKSKYGRADNLLPSIIKDKDDLAETLNVFYAKDNDLDERKRLLKLIENKKVSETIAKSEGAHKKLVGRVASGYLYAKNRDADELKLVSKVLSGSDFDLPKHLNEGGLLLPHVVSTLEPEQVESVVDLISSNKKFIKQFSEAPVTNQYGLLKLLLEKDVPGPLVSKIENLFSGVSGQNSGKALLALIEEQSSFEKDQADRLVKILKNEKTSEAYDARNLLASKVEDNAIKKSLEKQNKTYFNRVKKIDSLSGLDVSEQLKTLYLKSKHEGVPSPKKLLKQIDKKGDIPVVFDTSPDVDYKKWLLNLVTADETRGALDIDKEALTSIIQSSLKGDGDLPKEAVKSLKAESKFTPKEKVGIVLASSPSAITENTLDALTVIAEDAPGDKRLPGIVKQVLVDQSELTPKVGEKASALLNKLSTKSVSDVVKYASNNLDDPTRKIYVLAGAKEHKSASIRSFVKKNKDSTDVALREAVKEFTTKKPRSATGRASRQAASCGPGLGNVLQRLSFR